MNIVIDLVRMRFRPILIYCDSQLSTLQLCVLERQRRAYRCFFLFPFSFILSLDSVLGYFLLSFMRKLSMNVPSLQVLALQFCEVSENVKNFSRSASQAVFSLRVRRKLKPSLLTCFRRGPYAKLRQNTKSVGISIT